MFAFWRFISVCFFFACVFFLFALIIVILCCVFVRACTWFLSTCVLHSRVRGSHCFCSKLLGLKVKPIQVTLECDSIVDACCIHFL